MYVTQNICVSGIGVGDLV